MSHHPTATFILLVFSVSSQWTSAVAQSAIEPKYSGNAAVLKRGYTFIARVPNDPMDKLLTKSEINDFYFRNIEPKKSSEILTVQLPAPVNGMSQLITRTFDIDCNTGAARQTSLAMIDAQWKLTARTPVLKGSNWEIPAEQTYAYYAYHLTCAV